MKRKIIISLIAVFSISLVAFSLTRMNESPQPAPVEWGFTVNWYDSGCQCDELGATLEWRLYHDASEPPGIDGAGPFNIDPSLGTLNIVRTTSLPEQCTDDCYQIGATVTYYDASGTCCTGTATAYASYSDLVNKSITLNVYLN